MCITTICNKNNVKHRQTSAVVTISLHNLSLDWWQPWERLRGIGVYEGAPPNGQSHCNGTLQSCCGYVRQAIATKLYEMLVHIRTMVSNPVRSGGNCRL